MKLAIKIAKFLLVLLGIVAVIAIIGVGEFLYPMFCPILALVLSVGFMLYGLWCIVQCVWPTS